MQTFSAWPPGIMSIEIQEKMMCEHNRGSPTNISRGKSGVIHVEDPDGVFVVIKADTENPLCCACVKGKLRVTAANSSEFTRRSRLKTASRGRMPHSELLQGLKRKGDPPVAHKLAFSNLRAADPRPGVSVATAAGTVDKTVLSPVSPAALPPASGGALGQGHSVPINSCQGQHRHVPLPTPENLFFTETWENAPFKCTLHSGDRGSTQGGQQQLRDSSSSSSGSTTAQNTSPTITCQTSAATTSTARERQTGPAACGAACGSSSVS
ncbi:unnamed protein product [Pleuronectes platessa]|uniref:Uncharacterized protein n=1 Tax=Pleuronectes platessa TaxID=8262 RepID=A0A9N7VT41_PLEPL|nr:unnamed protein product [Pleuronectes platessa]